MLINLIGKYVVCENAMAYRIPTKFITDANNMQSFVITNRTFKSTRAHRSMRDCVQTTNTLIAFH